MFTVQCFIIGGHRLKIGSGAEYESPVIIVQTTMLQVKLSHDINNSSCIKVGF